MTPRVALLAACAWTLGACSSSASFEWREVTIGQTSRCLPVALGTAAQEQGLQGVKHVVRPMVFSYSPPATPSFWMKDTPAPLTGVWIGSSGRVIGYWRGKPESTELHEPPRPVAAVVEYVAGAQIPPIGSSFHIRGKCVVTDRRL